MIIRDVPPDERDQFRVHWEEGKKGLPCLDFRGGCPEGGEVPQGTIRGLLSADRQGWKGGKLPSKRRMYHLLRLVTKAALWGAFSRLASWLMGKILS